MRDKPANHKRGKNPVCIVFDYSRTLSQKEFPVGLRSLLIREYGDDTAHDVSGLNTFNSSVICGKELEGGSAVFGQMLIGNAYSTTPVSKVKFTIAQVNNDTKVWADMWMETQMAMGQVQQMAITDNASKNTIQQRLDELKP